ncbi:hypothetical protein Prum_058520 [Phytohabitans rumicis]|uniref:Uncharacterized protein n=1 Tax=Phytohabitans rumicis TaxID=1076125 RepID=A0A6V8L9C2_9ACTN|nr:hypothetical protein Prum_058520 [Phytohabitans rumicis]
MRLTDRIPGPSVCDPDAFRALAGLTPTDRSVTKPEPLPAGPAHAGTNGNVAVAVAKTNASTRQARRVKPE